MEHLFATMVRNSEIKNDVIYFGPMGCQTGFYLLVRNAEHEKVLSVIKKILKKIIAYNGEMPGNSPVECGNYQSLNLTAAKKEAQNYLAILQNKTTADMLY
jgi:S-ribosylhomocysteine lyase